MKRQELVRRLEASGCELHRHGKRHDIYRNPANGRQLRSLATAKLPIHSARSSCVSSASVMRRAIELASPSTSGVTLGP